MIPGVAASETGKVHPEEYLGARCGVLGLRPKSADAVNLLL